MTNFTHPEKVSLNDLMERIRSTDLVPSRAMLLEGLSVKMESMAGQNIHSLEDLQKTLKNSQKMEALAQATGIDRQYLVLLRREVESYTSKPFKLSEVDWLPREPIARLINEGIGNSDDLFNATLQGESVDRLEARTGVDGEILETLVHLADLVRVQWISLNFAHMIIEAGYTSARSIAEADAETLCNRLDEINIGGKYFNGKIGLRDVKRLIHSARYVI